MAQDSVLLDKSLHFAARIVKLYRYLLKQKHEAIISKQLIRSATSIGANANEAIYGNTKADFIAKLPPTPVIPSKARNPFPIPRHSEHSEESVPSIPRDSEQNSKSPLLKKFFDFPKKTLAFSGHLCYNTHAVRDTAPNMGV